MQDRAWASCMLTSSKLILIRWKETTMCHRGRIQKFTLGVITSTPSIEHITLALQQTHFQDPSEPGNILSLPHLHMFPHPPILFCHPALCPICQFNYHGIKSFQPICTPPLELSPTRPRTSDTASNFNPAWKRTYSEWHTLSHTNYIIT